MYNVSDVLGKELFSAKNRDSSKVAVPQEGVGRLVDIVGDDGGDRVGRKGCGGLMDQLGI